MQTPADFLNKVYDKVAIIKEIVSRELEKCEADGFTAPEYLAVLLFFQSQMNGLVQATLERSSLDKSSIETIQSMSKTMEGIVLNGIRENEKQLEKMN